MREPLRRALHRNAGRRREEVARAAGHVLATRLGAAAVDSLAAGRHGVLLGMLRGEIAATSLSEMAGRTRAADTALVQLARMLAM